MTRWFGELEPRHRCVHAAESRKRSLVIGDLEQANSLPKRRGRVSGHCTTALHAWRKLAITHWSSAAFSNQFCVKWARLNIRTPRARRRTRRATTIPELKSCCQLCRPGSSRRQLRGQEPPRTNHETRQSRASLDPHPVVRSLAALQRHREGMGYATPLTDAQEQGPMALARRLLVGIYVMMARGDVFNLKRCVAHT